MTDDISFNCNLAPNGCDCTDYCKGNATPSRPVTAGREEIARIVDPRSFEMDAEYSNNFTREAIARALAKADAILALGSAVSPQVLCAWQPIETAPKDGTHILAYRLPIGIRVTNLTNPPTVVHWFDDPEQPGFYTSVNERAPEYPFNPTHWKPLDAPPSPLPRAQRSPAGGGE